MVQVVIKAANGAVDDFRVSSAQPQWTVGELKNYLYRHYPTHPPIPSQKLIFSGQLLHNSQHLSEILSRSSEMDQVVIHLVAYDRSASAPALQTSVVHSVPPSSGQSSEEEEEGAGEGERERGEQVNLTPISSTNEGREPHSPAAAPPGHTPHPWLRYRPHQQHMQWFHGDPVLHNPPMLQVGGAYPYPQFYMPHYAAGNHAHMQQWYNAYYARPGGAGGGGVVGGGGGVVGGEVGGDGEDIDLPNQPDQPDNPDVDQDDLPMNAGAGGMMLAGPQFQARRDLVDYGYMLLMATVLVSVAYFTSSFGRIILFLGGVMFMFMNQAGWFSLRRRPRNVANVGGGDDLPNPLDHHGARNQDPPDENQQLPRQGEGERPLGEGERAVGTDTPDATTEPPVADPAPSEVPPPPRPGVLTVIFTFITTLFTSLLPQQQPDLQFQ